MTLEEKAKEIEKINCAIADFIGGKIITRKFAHGSDYYLLNGENWDVWALKYDQSWDWLMPVCKKIIQMYFEKRENIFEGLHECDIEKTHKAVYEFILFWNDDTQEKIIWADAPVSEQQLKWKDSEQNKWYNKILTNE